jgi:hypothetical protein
MPRVGDPHLPRLGGGDVHARLRRAGQSSPTRRRTSRSQSSPERRTNTADQTEASASSVPNSRGSLRSQREGTVGFRIDASVRATFRSLGALGVMPPSPEPAPNRQDQSNEEQGCRHRARTSRSGVRCGRAETDDSEHDREHSRYLHQLPLLSRRLNGLRGDRSSALHTRRGSFRDLIPAIRTSLECHARILPSGVSEEPDRT